MNSEFNSNTSPNLRSHITAPRPRAPRHRAVATGRVDRRQAPGSLLPTSRTLITPNTNTCIPGDGASPPVIFSTIGGCCWSSALRLSVWRWSTPEERVISLVQEIRGNILGGVGGPRESTHASGSSYRSFLRRTLSAFFPNCNSTSGRVCDWVSSSGRRFEGCHCHFKVQSSNTLS